VPAAIPALASPELAFDRGVELPTSIIISDDFLDLVRNSSISVKRSATLQFDRAGVTFADGTTLALDAVILCTGFAAALPFLDRTVLDAIGFNPADQLQPVLLHRNMFHPGLPGLTFIGHYRGPGFPVMELQARWIARILAGEQPMPDRAAMLAGIAEERVIRSQLPRPQFPHGDLVGLADGLAKEIGVFPTLSKDDPLRKRVFEGPMVPAQYRLIGAHAKPDLARALIEGTPAPILDDPLQTPSSVISGRRMLAMLRGHWAIQRHIEPGGAFNGVAVFSQRSTDSLLYHESGTLTLDNGIAVTGENSYVYALRDGVIDVSFATGLSRGQHFIDIALPEESSGALPFECTDRHHCRLDTYDATFSMQSATRFTMTYLVRGPAKDYVSRSEYHRLGETV
jgi:hypothetical protein